MRLSDLLGLALSRLGTGKLRALSQEPVQCVFPGELNHSVLQAPSQLGRLQRRSVRCKPEKWRNNQ